MICLRTPHRANKQVFRFYLVAWRCTIERGEVVSGLVWTGLHDNLCRLQDESSSMGKDDHYKKSDYVIQQDGVSAHMAKTLPDCLGANISYRLKDLWPPQSPDLNPLDFSFPSRVFCRVDCRLLSTIFFSSITLANFDHRKTVGTYR